MKDEQFLGLKTQKIFVPVVYTETAVRIINAYGDKAYLKLYELGKNMAITILKIWKPEVSKNIKDIIQDIFKTLFLYTPNIRIGDTKQEIIIEDDNCLFCWDVKTNINLCIGISAIIETILNYCHEKNPKIGSVVVENIKAKSTGSSQCWHKVKMAVV